jgi:hypothetical protein
MTNARGPVRIDAFRVFEHSVTQDGDGDIPKGVEFRTRDGMVCHQTEPCLFRVDATGQILKTKKEPAISKVSP